MQNLAQRNPKPGCQRKTGQLTMVNSHVNLRYVAVARAPVYTVLYPLFSIFLVSFSSKQRLPLEAFDITLFW